MRRIAPLDFGTAFESFQCKCRWKHLLSETSRHGIISIDLNKCWWMGLAFIGLLATCPTAHSVEKPELSALFPAGAQVGTVADVVVQGKFPVWPLQIWTDSPHVQWSCLEESGKLRVEIGENTELGLHWLRLFETNGATAARPYLVGRWPEISEVEPNGLAGQAQDVSSVPITIQGVLNRKADVDLFAIQLSQNQFIAATVDSAKWLNSPADTSLQVLDSHGFVLAENIDHVGLDPYLGFTAPKAGKYLVRVFGFPVTPDSTVAFGGGSDWMYRLRLEDTPGAMATAWDFTRQSELARPSIKVASGTHSTYEKALTVTLPARLSGTIAEPGQADYFRFLAKNGAHYQFAVFARDCGSPLDASLSLFDSDQKQLTRVDDVGQEIDPKIIWQAPADGPYVVSIADFHKLGGRDNDYFLTMEERSPSFTASVGSDLFECHVGQELEIAVEVAREFNYETTVQVGVDGLPESILCPAVESIANSDSAAKVTLKLKAESTWQGPLSIIARAVPSTVQLQSSHSSNDLHHGQIVESKDNKPLWLSVMP